MRTPYASEHWRNVPLESRETLRTLLSYMPSHALRFFDINIRQHFYSKELIESLLELANVFKINDEEWKCFARCLVWKAR